MMILRMVAMTMIATIDTMIMTTTILRSPWLAVLLYHNHHGDFNVNLLKCPNSTSSPANSCHQLASVF